MYKAHLFTFHPPSPVVLDLLLHLYYRLLSVCVCVYAVFPTLPFLNCLPFQLHVESKLQVI